MKYNGEYEVKPEFIKGGKIKWRTTGNGEYVIGTDRGGEHFIKRNIHARRPDKSDPEAVCKKYKKEADALEDKQNKLRSRMSGLDCRKDKIVCEERNFWDGERMFVTVTPLIGGVLPADYNLKALSAPTFTTLALKAATLLKKLHDCGVIHGDIKEKNFVLARECGEIEPYLIDFDSSYLAAEIPDCEKIGGSEGYLSPEVLLYAAGEVESPADITSATDIFALGIVFHRWWTGTFPGVETEKGSVGEAVCLGKAVTIDKKFDYKLGENCGATAMSLINWMLQKSPADRPTAEEVCGVLSDSLEVPERFHAGGDCKAFDMALWSAHKGVFKPLSADGLKALGVKSFHRINDGTGSAGLRYRVGFDDGERILSADELIRGGYAERIEAKIDEPWEEHAIEFEPAETISEKGYAEIKRARVVFRKRYSVRTNGGRVLDKGWEWLVSEGLAHMRRTEICADKPWEEHGASYNTDNMARFDVKSVSRVEIGGEHRYKIVYNKIVDGKNKTSDGVSANNLRLMGFLND